MGEFVKIKLSILLIISMCFIVKGQINDTITIVEYNNNQCYEVIDSINCLMSLDSIYSKCRPCYLKSYDSTRTLVFEGFFYQGQPIGKYKEFYDNGYIKLEGMFDSLTFKRKGVWNYVNTKGELVFAYKYGNGGKLIDVMIYSRRIKDWYINEVKVSYYWIDHNCYLNPSYDTQRKILLKMLIKSITRLTKFGQNRRW